MKLRILAAVAFVALWLAFMFTLSLAAYLAYKNHTLKHEHGECMELLREALPIIEQSNQKKSYDRF